MSDEPRNRTDAFVKRATPSPGNASPREDGTEVNDVHARISRARVARIVTPAGAEEVARLVADARSRGEPLSVAGSRHSMGGQPFANGATLLDASRLDSIGALDPERGTIDVGAGVRWPALVGELVARQGDREGIWTIAQKQTGADRLSIGGAVSSNVHGRGLAMKPFVGDIESLEVVDPFGRRLVCSRAEHPELFRLVVGGYGMFGVITSVKLRLARRRRVVRRVRLARSEDAVAILEEQRDRGAAYGDFQFAVDREADGFLRDGILSCYAPIEAVPAESVARKPPRALAEGDWRRLIRLAHEDPTRGFEEYVAHYLATDGGLYWSDTHQLGTYVDGYHDELDAATGRCGSEVIGELYVPRPDLERFLERARRVLRRDRARVIYGTVRLIERDDESLLAWAREPWACTVFNLHTEHTPAALKSTASSFRGLIDAARELGGSYYLTYHRWATREQAQACHPALRRFVALKRERDPGELLTSDWWRALSSWYPARAGAGRTRPAPAMLR